MTSPTCRFLTSLYSQSHLTDWQTQKTAKKRDFKKCPFKNKQQCHLFTCKSKKCNYFGSTRNEVGTGRFTLNCTLLPVLPHKFFSNMMTTPTNSWIKKQNVNPHLNYTPQNSKIFYFFFHKIFFITVTPFWFLNVGSNCNNQKEFERIDWKKECDLRRNHLWPYINLSIFLFLLHPSAWCRVALLKVIIRTKLKWKKGGFGEGSFNTFQVDYWETKKA